MPNAGGGSGGAAAVAGFMSDNTFLEFQKKNNHETLMKLFKVDTKSKLCFNFFSNLGVTYEFFDNILKIFKNL